MPTPEMLEGMRAPRSVRLEDIRKSTEAALNAPAPSPYAPAGVTVYVSPYRKYRVQITAPPRFSAPDGSGRTLPSGKMYVAEFEEGVFRNNHRDAAVRTLFDEQLQSNPYFGRFGGGPKVHYWLASDQNATTEGARIQAALATLKALPKEVVDQYVADLHQGDADDHDLAPAPEPAPAPRAGRKAA